MSTEASVSAEPMVVTDSSSSGAKESSAPVEAGTKASESTGADSSNLTSSAPETSSAPAFTPNFKFKANQKEMEFDEFLRPTIKDADTEKKIRELYEKAHGLDTIKPERDQLKTQYTELHREHSSVQNGLQKLSRFVQEKDYESFFQALGVPKSDVMQYALLQLKLQEASPEQRAAYEQQLQTKQRAYELEQQNQYLQSSYEQQAVAIRSNELNLALQRPEVSPAMQAFDARLGRVGAFRDEVIKRGQYYHAVHGQDIPVEQAVNEVLGMFGQSQPAQGAAQVVSPEKIASQKKVIPNIQGRSASPVQRTIKDLDDLKSYANERLQANA